MAQEVDMEKYDPKWGIGPWIALSTERFLVDGEGVWPVTGAVLRGGVVGRGSGDHSRRTYATDVDVLDTGQNIAGPYQITGNQPSNVNVCGLETLAPVSALLRLSSGSPHVTLFYDRDVSEWWTLRDPSGFLRLRLECWNPHSLTGTHPFCQWRKKDVLQDCPLPPQTTLIQYVDDLLLAAPTAETCVKATSLVLQHLHQAGFKVSKNKLQVARKQVSFLGRIISAGTTSMSPSHKQSILQHPKPSRVKDMLSFLGLTGYSRSYIPSYTDLTQSLRALVKEQGMRNLNNPLIWTTEAEQAFISLKQNMALAAELSLPDYTLPFFLDVSVTKMAVNGVLFQKKGGERKVLMYLSVMMDNMEKRHPPCTQHAAGIAKLIQKTAHIVMGHTLQVLTTHSVVAYVNSQSFTMTALRQQRLSKVLEAPNISFTHEGINMADCFADGEPHECAELVAKSEKVRPDLEATPLIGPEVRQFFTDGCCYRHQTQELRAGFAVVESTKAGFLTRKAERLEGTASEQRAEIKAVIEALKLAQGSQVNVYTDSAYVAGTVHLELCQWMRGGSLTTSGQTLKHKEVVRCQKGVPLEEKNMWKQRGATETNGCWRGPDGRLILPPGRKQELFQEAHGVGHVGTKQMMHNLKDWWHPQMINMVKQFVNNCEMCGQVNPKKTLKPHQGQFLPLTGPGKEVVLDFTDMINMVQGKKYLLVCVDAFTGWPEAWPAAREDSKTVIKCLINHYIPRHSFPEKNQIRQWNTFQKQGPANSGSSSWFETQVRYGLSPGILRQSRTNESKVKNKIG
ncbi:uncharacterized protein LOC116731589 [Xiphophorus hellerii]|uniref:uncharacterized protein LOC116731589 n=1 Tax=Xiphophorus hellerii TaxID=8084 RepID=UPI0013B3C7D9|nr:uncharacterized protein LOC116731589 [Xiphophorus hellerii]